jgi:thiol-disulfide isomerase/thioredoxin
MTKNTRIGLGLIVAILIIAWGFSMQFKTKDGVYSGRPITQKSAPDFKLTSIEKDTISLSQFKGKLVYLKFWASWCGDCIKQVVPQRKIEADLASNPDIAFVNISVDEDLEAWERSVARNKLMGVELISKEGEDADINNNYGINEIPRYVVIDKNGIILDNNAPKPSEIDSDYFLNLLK